MNQIKLDKMRELELKDIACYVPYKPKCNVMGGCDDDGNAIVYTVTGCDNDRNGSWVFVGDDGVENCEALEDVFLLLRPMSDLTKEITVEGYNNGELFVPLIKIAELCNVGTCGRWSVDGSSVKMRDNGTISIIDISDIEVCSYEAQDLLNQWHFDYRNLIDKGLAIDINTLNK